MTVNREEMLNMRAGLELDMLIGQYVIGFEDYLKESDKRPVVRDGRYGKNYFDLPNYSTDISAAWEVLEKMQSKGIYLDIRSYADFYMVEVRKESGMHLLDSCSQGLTAPYAICIASLKSVNP